MQDKYYLDDLEEEEEATSCEGEPPVKYSTANSTTASSLPNKRIHKRPIFYTTTDPTHLSDQGYGPRSQSLLEAFPRSSSAINCPDFTSSNSVSLDWPLATCTECIEEITKIAKLTPEKKSGLMARINKLSEFAYMELTSKGYCGVNHLLGNIYAENILDLAKQLYKQNIYVPGEHAVKGISVRSDNILWIGPDNLNAYKSQSLHILLNFLDAVILNLSDRLSDCDLTHKSRAMIACYPPNSGGYDKHCDNPKALNDGRYLTFIYYLNPNWNSTEDGGDLIMWPTALPGSEIKLSPMMDRSVIFYSDERTLHQVTPNKKERFALTLWYFDKNARRNYWLRQHKAFNAKS